MADIFSGDPYITLGPNGSTLHYVGGQPRMDKGLENQAIISLFSEADWVGNYLIDNPDQQLNGGRFLKACKQPITLQTLTDIEQGATADLTSPAFGKVTVTATNPESNRLNVRILIQPPGQDETTLILTRSGLNWQAQALDPAHGKV